MPGEVPLVLHRWTCEEEAQLRKRAPRKPRILGRGKGLTERRDAWERWTGRGAEERETVAYWEQRILHSADGREWAERGVQQIGRAHV